MRARSLSRGLARRDSFGSARDMHKAYLFPPRLIERLDGFRGGLHSDRASFFLEIIARLGRQTYVAFLTGAYDQEIGAILIDKFRLLFGDDVRRPVLFLR